MFCHVSVHVYWYVGEGEKPCIFNFEFILLVLWTQLVVNFRHHYVYSVVHVYGYMHLIANLNDTCTSGLLMLVHVLQNWHSHPHLDREAYNTHLYNIYMYLGTLPLPLL